MQKSIVSQISDVELLERIISFISVKRSKMKWWQRMLFDLVFSEIVDLLNELRSRIIDTKILR